MGKKKNPIIPIDHIKLADDEILYPANPFVRPSSGPLKEYYYTTNKGRAFSISSGEMKELGGKVDNRGYRRFKLMFQNGTNSDILAHRLTMCTIYPNIVVDELQVNHKNGKEKSNNSTDNLEWVDGLRNIQHAVATGLMHGLTDSQFKEAMEKSKNGATDKEISAEYGITEEGFANMRTGRNGYDKRLERLKLDPVYKKKDITDDMLIIIMEMAKNKIPDSIIGEAVNLSPSEISKIRSGRKEFGARLENLGYDPEKYFSTLSDDDMYKLFELAKNGKSDTEIAEILNISVSSVENIRIGNGIYKEKLKRLGIDPIRQHNRLSMSDIKRAMEMLYAGSTDEEVAKIFNISAGGVKQMRTGQHGYAKKLKSLGINPLNRRRSST